MRIRARAVSAGLLLLATSIAGLAQSAAEIPTDAAGHPDFSGYWELRLDGKSVPPATLKQEFQRSGAAAKARQSDLTALVRCDRVGMPVVMDNGAVIDILQSPKIIGVIAKVSSSARYIYTDGRQHPEKDEMIPGPNGNSIGRWEGDTLVVDTTGFNDLGITSLPGGGVRTRDSHLVERYRLLNGGQILSVTFAWEDPKVFQKPHTYEYRYYRTQMTYPRIFSCFANDQNRAEFLKRADVQEKRAAAASPAK